MRLALLLHGRVGTVGQKPSISITNSVPNVTQQGALGLVRLSAASHMHHIVMSGNISGWSVDVYVHSWNPELARVLDAQYGLALRGSLHEQVIPGLAKAASQSLSIARAAALARRHELHAGRGHWQYDHALVMRLDAVPLEPLDLSALSAGRVTFAEHCCLDAAVDLSDAEAVLRQCGHGLGATGYGGVRWGVYRRVPASCRVQPKGRRRGRQRMARTWRAAYFVQDWWFAAPLALALSWAQISTQWAWYENRSLALGFGLRGEHLWSNVAWAIHAHDALNHSMQLRFARWHVVIGRHVYRHLLMNTPGPLGGSGSGACNEQAFDPGVLLTSREADASLRQIVESREPGQLLSAEARAVFFGRFEPMARACPAANYMPRHRRVVCCGNATYHRRWCGPVRRHQRACRRAWRSLQPALDPSDRSAMLRDLDASGRRWVAWWNRRHRCDD